MPQKTSELSLYSEAQAKDNCGFGLIVNRHGTLNRDVVTRSIAGLTSMTHRGAIGSDGKTGDGCGLLFDLNQGFFQKRIKKELNLAKKLFGQSLHIVPFDGTHAVNKNLINTLTKTSFKNG